MIGQLGSTSTSYSSVFPSLRTRPSSPPGWPPVPIHLPRACSTQLRRPRMCPKRPCDPGGLSPWRPSLASCRRCCASSCPSYSKARRAPVEKTIGSVPSWALMCRWDVSDLL